MSLRPSISQLRDLGHHATYYNWGIQFISIPSALTGFTSSDLNTRAVSFKAPSRTQQVTDISLRGHKVRQHGIMDYESGLDLVLHETVDSKVGKFLEAWMDLQWVPISGIQVPKNGNQAVFLLTLLDSQDSARMYYTIAGAWPSAASVESNYSADTSETVKWNSTWQYDYYTTV